MHIDENSLLNKITSKQFFIFVIICIYLLTWMLQHNLLIEADTCWLIYAAKNLINGGTYTNNFFDPNPPLIFYLYTPIVLLMKYFRLEISISLLIYMYCISTGSIFLCYLISKKIFAKDDKLLMGLFLIFISIVFLILPVNEFGQREQLSIILTMPYFLTTASRLDKKHLPFIQYLIAGLLGSIGFAIKPHFLITLFIVEIYYLFYQHDWLGWLRTEILTMIVFFFCYALLIITQYQDYLTIIVPYSIQFLYQKYSSWQALFLYSVVLFSYAVIYAFIFLYKKIDYHNLSTILCIATIGFLISYYLQYFNWYHHALPAYSTAILLSSFLFCILSVRSLISKNFYDYLFIFLLGLILFYFPIHLLIGLHSDGVHDKQTRISSNLTQFMKKHHKSVYFITSDFYIQNIDYAHVDYLSRFPFFILFRGLPNQELLPSNPIKYQNLTNAKKYTIKMISEDLNIKKPELVFVQENIISRDFLQNLNFQSAWKKYRFLTTILQPGTYRFEVYQRS